MDNKIALVAVVVIVILLVVGYAIISSNKRAYGTTTTSSVVSTIVPNSNTTSINENVNYASGCVGSAGYNCTAANISSSGEVTLSLTQNSGDSFYNLHVACGVIDLQGVLVNSSSWYALTNLGTTKASNFSGTTMTSGSKENIASLQCYDQMGYPVSVSPGQSYQGTILLEYTNSTASPGSGNPWITVTAAEVDLASAQG